MKKNNIKFYIIKMIVDMQNIEHIFSTNNGDRKNNHSFTIYISLDKFCLTHHFIYQYNS